MRTVFSFYADATKIALQAIMAHKLRAFLTLIGIIIGVASVVVVGASIDSLNSYVVERLSKMLGANHFMISRIASAGRLTQEEWERMNRRNKRLDWDNYDWLRTHCTTCSEVGAQVITSVDIDHEGQELLGVRLFGVTANMVEIEDKEISEGRFLLNHEVERAAMVCVLGADLREKFFPGLDPKGDQSDSHGFP